MMTRQAQFSTLISITLHILALLIFAGVKIYTDKSAEDGVLVTFVDVQKTKPLRRSASVRPMISLDKTPQRHAPEQNAILPERRSSVGFYVSEPVKVFSAVESTGQGLFRDTGIQRPAAELRGRSSNPIASVGPEESKPNSSQMQSHISGGHELLGDAAKGPAKPGADFAGEALQNFARAVRKKIESSKKYPVAAQTARIEGRTGVKITILRDGRLKKVEVAKPSGRKVLDRAAIQSVRDAAPFPPIPEKLRRDEIELSITLVFKIT